MKRGILLVMLVAVLVLLSACGNEGNKTVQKNEPMATQEPKGSGIEKFKSGTKYGLRKGREIITDAIWDSIIEYQAGDEYIYLVEFAGNPNRKGMMKSDGTMVIEPEWNHLLKKSDKYLVGNKKDERKYHVFDIQTGNIVYTCDTYISAIEDEYVITNSYSASAGEYTYSIIDMQNNKKLCNGIPSKNGPVFYQHYGYQVGESFVSLSGQVKNGKITAELLKEKTNYKKVDTSNFPVLIYSVYKRDVTRNGSSLLGPHYSVSTPYGKTFNGFTINSQHIYDWYTTEEGHQVIIADAMTPSKDPGYVFFDATSGTAVNIEGASYAHHFNDGMALVRNENNKYGFINDHGEFVYSYQFDNAEDFHDGVAEVVKDYKKVIIDKKGDGQEAVYAQAKARMEQGDYLGAYDLLITITKYKDVPDLLKNEQIVRARRLIQYQPGKEVTFGSYYEPIEWLILDRKDNDVLLISKKILDYITYHDYNYNKAVGASWENCSLRNWLNTTFLETAFSAQKREGILLTKTTNAAKDYVFLLSESEAKNYYDLLKKTAQTTAHAQAVRNQKTSSFTQSKSNYWLVRGNKVSRTSNALTFFNDGWDAGIRPAIWVSVDVLP